MEKKSKPSTVSGKNRRDNMVRVNLRIQDKELQEMRDEGRDKLQSFMLVVAIVS